MKKKILLAAVLALSLCISACAPRSTNNDTSSNSKTEADKSDSQSVADGEISAAEQSEADVSSEKTKSVIMGIAGNNAQGIDVKIDIPENWDVGVEKITEDGHFIARFGIASKCTSDADEAIDIILAAEEGSDVVIKEIDGAKNIVKYCKTKVKMYTGHDDWITDGVRYSFGSGKLVCDIFFAAEEGADLDQERAKFEACLKTLEIIS